LHGAINQRQFHDLEDVIDEDVDWVAQSTCFRFSARAAASPRCSM
jgi:hypothetical protein